MHRLSPAENELEIATEFYLLDNSRKGRSADGRTVFLLLNFHKLIHALSLLPHRYQSITGYSHDGRKLRQMQKLPDGSPEPPSGTKGPNKSESRKTKTLIT